MACVSHLRREVVTMLQRVTAEFGLTGELVKSKRHATWVVEAVNLRYPVAGSLEGRALKNTESYLRRYLRERTSV